MFKFLFVAAAMVFAIDATAQHRLSGVVLDADNEALTGATVEIAESKNLTVTDHRGRFQLSRLKEGSYTLQVRFIGFESVSQTVTIPSEGEVEIRMVESTTLTDEVIVYATRANENTPTTFSTVSRENIIKQNFGQDLPYVLNWTPSLVTTSDAGTGFGYTGLRIRGSDATAINVTINGIPYNDSESLGTFWVDIPDIASSSQNIQIQRGVGTSTNGAGAFGATINLQTTSRSDEAYATIVNSVGFLGASKDQNVEYNSRRHTIGFGTGLVNDHWIIDGRFSKIASDGFIDRATADLSSYYLSAGFYAGKTIVKAITFGGKERTYQAWYGVPESRLKGDEEAMLTTAMNEGWNDEQTENLLNADSRTFNPYTYKDQVDDYRQDHYQVHLSHAFNDSFTGNFSLHYTPGKGYYEEYKPDDEFEDYGLDPALIGSEVVTQSDLVRRRWLDNDFYGFTTAFSYEKEKLSLTFGGGANRYVGGHFGEIIWAEVSPVPTGYRYYNTSSDKKDLNVYAKANFPIVDKLNGFIDLQQRIITYEAIGGDDDGTTIAIDDNFQFFNPKAGVTYELTGKQQLYSSVSVAHREPVRSDFINAPQGKMPTSERLVNVEAGYRLQSSRLIFNGNVYLMRYKDQLIHTGMVNDVGSPIRSNVEESYRSGIELDGTVYLTDKWSLNANLTLSRNKIRDFTEVVYDYGVNWDEYNTVSRTYENTDIAFSPATIAGAILTYRPVQGVDLSLLSKYISRQYLDNTSNRSRSLDPYFVNDIRLSWIIKPSWVKEVTLSVLANNILDEEFESNGYTWGYLGGGDEYRENYYYPQAGRNFMIMLALRF
jgi:iron complex outermembrane recepter protein